MIRMNELTQFSFFFFLHSNQQYIIASINVYLFRHREDGINICEKIKSNQNVNKIFKRHTHTHSHAKLIDIQFIIQIIKYMNDFFRFYRDNRIAWFFLLLYAQCRSSTVAFIQTRMKQWTDLYAHKHVHIYSKSVTHITDLIRTTNTLTHYTLHITHP